jgi:hypothetical protein
MIRARFKLLLRSSLTTTSDDIPRPILPPQKGIIDVYADFYRYLFERSRAYIKETIAVTGELVWNSLEENIDFILSHPNGWEGRQQAEMRRSVVKAGLIPDTPEGHSRVTFVTEGEASLHYCIVSGNVTEEIKVKYLLLIGVL